MGRGKKENEIAAQDKNKKIKWNDQDFQVNGNAREAMETLGTHLKKSKKGGLFGGFRKNSDYFNNVERGLESVVRELDGTFTGNMQEDIQVMEQIANAYDRLIEACEAYNNRNAHTAKGETRQGIVAKILERAQSDHAKLAEYFGNMPAIPEKDRAKTPVEALEKVRRRTVELPLEHTHLGGAASDVLKFKESGSDKNVYFKEEETFRKKEEWQYVLDAMAKLQSDEKFAIPKSQYEKIVNQISTEKSVDFDIFKKDSTYFSDRRYHEFLDRAEARKDAVETVESHVTKKTLLNMGNVEKDISVSKRNVAASRFAELLGVGELIARSETVTLRSSSGTETEGILMEEAGRMEGKKARQQLVGENYRQKQNNAGKEDPLPDAREHVKHAISAEFQRGLADLQVLDALMGQIDRHADNYMTDIKDGKLGVVKGIDNDFSFGNTTLKGDDAYFSTGFTKGIIGNHGRSPVNGEGEMAIPYMSERLKDGILAVTEGQIRFILKDLVEPEAIDACWKRVSEMQMAILLDLKKFETNGGTYRYLKEDEWNSETLEAFLSQDRENYLSKYMSQDLIDKSEKAVITAERLEIAEQLWDDDAREFDFTDPDIVCQFLNIVTNGEYKDKIRYFRESGLMQEWCMERKKGVAFKRLPADMQVKISEYIDKPEIRNKLNDI